MLLAEFRKRADRLADLLPWSHLLRPDVVALKDGGWLAGFAMAGLDEGAMDPAERLALRARLSAALAQLGGGWALWVEQRVEPVARYELACDPHAPDALRRIERERAERFASGWRMERRLVLWVACYRAALRGEAGEGASLLVEGADNPLAQLWRAFLDKTDQIEGLLSGVMASVERLSGDALLSELASSVATTPCEVRAPSTPAYLDAYLAREDLTPGLAPMLGAQHLAVIGLRDLPGATTPDLIDALAKIEVPHRWVSRWLALDLVDARALMRRARRRWQAKARPALGVVAEMMHGERGSAPADPEAILMIDDSDEALASLAAAKVAYGLYSAVLVTSHEDPAVAAARAGALEEAMVAIGLPAKRERLGAVDAWLGCAPGDVKANVRRFPLHAAGLADLLPRHSAWRGSSKPFALARADGGEAFGFGLFDQGSDVGHMAVLGPTGAGKSVLLAFMALSWLRRPDARVVIVDRHRSCRAAVLAAGGRFHALEGPVFQPLAEADETARQWLLAALDHGGVARSPALEADVKRVVDLLRSLPIQERTLDEARALLGAKEARAALGNLPDWFDGIAEEGEGAGEGAAPVRIEAFETDHLLRHPAAPLAIMHLARAFERRFDGAPTLLILDEAWQALSHGAFGPMIEDWLRTLRKRNAAVVFATQAIADLTRSPHAAALLEQTPNRVFLPNPRASEPSTRAHYEDLGLGDALIAQIAHAAPKRDYLVTSPRGARLVDFALGPTALGLCGRAAPADQRLLDDLQRDGVKGAALLDALTNEQGRAHHATA